MKNNLQQTFGNIDIYLFDQLLKGTYANCKTVLDVGCGGGRNLIYFLQNGYEVFGVDPSAEAVNEVKQISYALAPTNSLTNFKVARAEELPYSDSSFDLVICSAVLHFAESNSHFDTMLKSMWRVLKSGGYFFARLATDIGIESLVEQIGNNRFLLPDGSERYLVNEETLLKYSNKLNGILHEPIKTTNVQNLRCMTTWCLSKQ